MLREVAGNLWQPHSHLFALGVVLVFFANSCSTWSKVANIDAVHWRSVKTIPWIEAEALLRSGRVKEVFQPHSLTVFITSLDGETVCSNEPSMDYVVDLIRKENLHVELVLE